MATVKVADLLAEIQTNHKQVSASQRDEVRVMQAMLNDTSYEVGVYGKAARSTHITQQKISNQCRLISWHRSQRSAEMKRANS